MSGLSAVLSFDFSLRLNFCFSSSRTDKRRVSGAVSCAVDAFFLVSSMVEYNGSSISGLSCLLALFTTEYRSYCCTCGGGGGGGGVGTRFPGTDVATPISVAIDSVSKLFSSASTSI